jgi:hypothetical protein
MMWKSFEIKRWLILGRYITRQELGIICGWHWDIEMRPVFRPEVDMWNRQATSRAGAGNIQA